ncbi:MAG: alpha/beta fold hydrolase [Granulosicoccus sp.]
MSRLNATQSGQGPFLVMLHGLFGSADNFRAIASQLEEQFRVLRLDLPGHGQSPTQANLSIEAMADAVIVELSERGITDYHLLGHSLGGKVAMCIAGRMTSQAIRSVCIVDIAPKAYPPHHENIFTALSGIDLRTLTDRRSADKQLLVGIPDPVIRAFVLKSLYRDATKAFQWRFDLPGLHRNYTHICQAPVMEKCIEQPALFIKGGDSGYIESSDEAVIRPLFARPSLKIIAGAGHWPHAEKPALFARMCQTFVTDADAYLHENSSPKPLQS